MRILHTADWHLGKRLEHFSRLDEQRLVLDEICSIADAENVDVVFVAGDLFDNFNPSSEVVELLYRTLKRLTNNGARSVIAIAGNHDSADRIEAPDALAKECGIFFSGYPHTHIETFATENNIQITQSEPGFVEMLLPNIAVPLRLLLTPYANEIRLKTFMGLENPDAGLNGFLAERWKALADKYCDEKGVNLLVAHLYMMQNGGMMPEESEDERPILIGNASAVFTENIPPQIQYTALGHIHRAQNIDKEKHVHYSGSPLAYSFAEAGQTKQVNIIDLQPNEKAVVRSVVLKSGRPLLRKKFGNMDDALQWLDANQDALVELTIQTEQFLAAKDRKAILGLHSGVIAIIPEIIGDDNNAATHIDIDLSQDIETLFQQYFKYKRGQDISEDLVGLFKEMQSQDTSVTS
ncbi:MAG: exonuclease subunit SbcD [Chitinophagaceae bacterium]